MNKQYTCRNFLEKLMRGKSYEKKGEKSFYT